MYDVRWIFFDSNLDFFHFSSDEKNFSIHLISSLSGHLFISVTEINWCILEGYDSFFPSDNILFFDT